MWASLIAALFVAAAPATDVRGIALGMWSADPEHDYGRYLDEIRSQGARDVELVVTWVQQDLRATDIQPRAGYSPSQANVVRTIRQARERGLRVLVFPILRIHQRRPDEWRGKIRFATPAVAAKWWTSYRAFIEAMAMAAQEGGAERLSVGSELLEQESDRAQWATLIGGVRKAFTGRVMYSANWDHYGAVSFWDLVDDAGMTAYFELTQHDDPTVEQLVAAWDRWTPAISKFAAHVGKPLYFTEVGYPSLDGANRYPWDETRRTRVDTEEQRRCYEALVRVLDSSPFIRGTYFWNWYLVGGPDDGDYTPRGKPAAAVMRAWLHGG